MSFFLPPKSFLLVCLCSKQQAGGTCSLALRTSRTALTPAKGIKGYGGTSYPCHHMAGLGQGQSHLCSWGWLTHAPSAESAWLYCLGKLQDLARCIPLPSVASGEGQSCLSQPVQMARCKGGAYFPSPCHMIDKGGGTSSSTLKSSLQLQPERGVSNSMNSYHLSLLVATGAINSNTDPGCSRAMGVHGPWQQLRPRYHCRLGWQVGHRPQSSLPTPLRICLSHRTWTILFLSVCLSLSYLVIHLLTTTICPAPCGAVRTVFSPPGPGRRLGWCKDLMSSWGLGQEKWRTGTGSYT